MKKLIRLTEGDLHKIIKESVKKIINEGWTGRGYVPSNGNHMVGGNYGRDEITVEKDIMDEFLDSLQYDEISEEEFKEFENYCKQNPNVFIVEAIISSSYDESTGYGSSDYPIMEFESISGKKEMLNYVAKYHNQKIAQVAVQILQDILDNLEIEDFEID